MAYPPPPRRLGYQWEVGMSLLSLAPWLVILSGLFFAGSVWASVTAYRKGFRAAIDFLDGRRELPPLIISWRRALWDPTRTEQ